MLQIAPVAKFHVNYTCTKGAVFASGFTDPYGLAFTADQHYLFAAAERRVSNRHVRFQRITDVCLTSSRCEAQPNIEFALDFNEKPTYRIDFCGGYSSFDVD